MLGKWQPNKIADTMKWLLETRRWAHTFSCLVVTKCITYEARFTGAWIHGEWQPLILVSFGVNVSWEPTQKGVLSLYIRRTGLLLLQDLKTWKKIGIGLTNRPTTRLCTCYLFGFTGNWSPVELTLRKCSISEDRLNHVGNVYFTRFQTIWRLFCNWSLGKKKRIQTYQTRCLA